MLAAVAITVGSILLGATVGAAARRQSRWLIPLRTFAVTAVASAVLVQLLPEAVHELGAAGLLAFVAALALPSLVAPVLRAFRRPLSAGTLGVELGFWAFLGHQAAEGFALGAYASDKAHAGHDHGTLIVAVAAHTLPLTAVFVSEALLHRGRASAIRRTAALLLSTVLGFFIANVAAVELHGEVHSWLSAGIAGFLVHVVFHHQAEHRHARTSAVRTLDVAGAVIGLCLPLAAASPVPGHGTGVRREVFAAFGELLMETAPMLLLGLVLGAALQVVGSRIPAHFLSRGNAWRQAWRGVAVGAPLPLCACGVLPIAESLRRRGAGPALVMAFLLVTPELGPETLTLTVRFLGWPFALVRIGSAIALAVVAAVAFEKWARWGSSPSARASGSGTDRGLETSERPSLRRAYAYFDELVLHTAPWTLVGLLAAAYVEAVIPEGSLAPLRASGLDVILVAVLALPSYVCAASATPLAAVLLLKGVSPGAVLIGLLLGPATNIATIGVLRRAYGARATLGGMLTIFAVSLSFAYAVNAAGLQARVPEALEHAHEHGFGTLLALAILAVVLAVQLWRNGARPWLEILQGSHGHGEGHHAHDHAGHGCGGHHHHHHPSGGEGRRP